MKRTTTTRLPPIKEVIDPYIRLRTLYGLEPGSRIYTMGQCRIIVSPPFDGNGWHLSMSHPHRLPTWDELSEAWYALVPDAENRVGHMILPRKEEYVNLHAYTLHVHEAEDPQGPSG